MERNEKRKKERKAIDLREKERWKKGKEEKKEDRQEKE